MTEHAKSFCGREAKSVWLLTLNSEEFNFRCCGSKLKLFYVNSISPDGKQFLSEFKSIGFFHVNKSVVTWSWDSNFVGFLQVKSSKIILYFIICFTVKLYFSNSWVFSFLEFTSCRVQKCFLLMGNDLSHRCPHVCRWGWLVRVNRLE